MHCRNRAIAAAIVFTMAQTPALAAPVPAQDEQEFCALVERMRAGTASGDAAARQSALLAARSEAEAFIQQHRGIDWVGPIGRIIFSKTDKAAGEIEVCPSSWVGGLSPEGALDSDTWAETDTHLFNLWHDVTPGRQVEFRAALLGIYDMRPDFPAKIWVRARIVDLSPLP